MADAYTYLGDDTRGYLAYVDADTERMLIAERGGTYHIRAVEANQELPPNDGRWNSTAGPPTVVRTTPTGDVAPTGDAA